MPEAKHYGNELLDNCYLYTFDDQYTESVKQELGRNAVSPTPSPYMGSSESESPIFLRVLVFSLLQMSLCNYYSGRVNQDHYLF